MDMWNWLHDCYDDGSLTLEDLEEALNEDRIAEELWKEYADYSADFVETVRDEIKPFIKYIKEKEAKQKN